MTSLLRRRPAVTRAIVGAGLIPTAARNAPATTDMAPGAARTTIAALVAAVAVGCAAQSAPPAAPVAHATVVTFDPHWMGLGPDQPRGWKELNRRITSEFQQFGLRPADENDNRYGCNGCAPWTVTLTAYAPGAFDPAATRAGEPIGVNSAADGVVLDDPARQAATLAWQYAENAWATVRGSTPATTQHDRMVELARALRPEDRTPIRLPLSVPNVPTHLPLAEINVDADTYGTTLTFAPCARAVTFAEGACVRTDERLDVQIWPTDDFDGHINQRSAVAMTIGGRIGLFDDALDGAGDHAAVQVRPGMLVVFNCGRPGPHYAGTPAEPPTSLPGVLANVEWASDPDNHASWPAVADWAN